MSTLKIVAGTGVLVVGALTALIVVPAGVDESTPAPPLADPAPISAVTPVTPVALNAETGTETMVVYKAASCGCCSKWIAHLEAEGFAVEAIDVDNLPEVKRRMGVSPEHQSCHTAIFGDYVIEGHVPASAIRRLLAERPEGVVGLAVPGMIVGTPGMEVDGRPAQPYNVLAFDAHGGSTVFEAH